MQKETFSDDDFQTIDVSEDAEQFDEAAFHRHYNEAVRSASSAAPKERQNRQAADMRRKREERMERQRRETESRISGGRQRRPQRDAAGPAQDGKQAQGPIRGQRDTPRQAAQPPAGSANGRQASPRSGFGRVVSALLIIIAVLLGSLTGAVMLVAGSYHASDLQPNAYTDENALMRSAGVTNILLMGIDTEDSTASTRSDAMILMSIDSLHAKIKLSSFMRDMYVEVPGYGYTKLTHACIYGGPQLTVDTIELNFGIDIDAYAKIGYDLFRELAEGVGGITVPEIDATESAALAIEGVYIEPGTDIHLDGNETLQYCRTRKGQSDFQRTERQRQAITLIIKKALKTNPVKLVFLARSIVGKLECSCKKTELIPLALRAVPCMLGEIGQQQIPADGTWDGATRDGMSVLLVDTEANRQVLHDFIYN